jgi:hypothetical protein
MSKFDHQTVALAFGVVLNTQRLSVSVSQEQLAERANFPLHRYAMVLHTDQKRPHVHLVVKAENELSKRLRIDKALL